MTGFRLDDQKRPCGSDSRVRALLSLAFRYFLLRLSATHLHIHSRVCPHPPSAARAGHADEPGLPVPRTREEFQQARGSAAGEQYANQDATETPALGPEAESCLTAAHLRSREEHHRARFTDSGVWGSGVTVSAVPGLAGVTGAPPESSESCRKLQASEGEGSASGALRGLPPSHPKPPPAETALSGRVRVVSLALSLHRFGLPGALRPPQGTAVPGGSSRE